MKKITYVFPLLLLFSGCCKKKPSLMANSRPKQESNPEWQKAGSARFDDDVDEFFLEDDEDGNIFESGSGPNITDQELEMVSMPLDEQSAETIQFDYDRTNIKPEEQHKIESNVDHAKDVLKDNPDAVVVVDGHSCKIAKNQTYNYMISQERAESVAQEYIDKGVPKEKVKPVGHGSSNLLTNADGKEAQSINRRVETHFKRV